jgi:hypothetical protein
MVVASVIDSVQVFRRGATVIRRAILDDGTLADGCPAEVELFGLPLSLMDPTAKVRILESTGANVTATGVAIGIHVREGLPPEKPPEQKEIEAIDAEIKESEELARLLDGELELLTEIPVPDRPEAEHGRAPPPAPLTMRLALEAFADDAAEARRTERRALERQLRTLHTKRAALMERTRAASTAAEVKKGDLSKSLIVSLRADGRPTRVVIELRYIVPGAAWTPAYQVKLSRDGGAAAVHMRAHVAQRSGEDWLGVKMSLSTASPLRFSELPELSAIRIGKAQPQPPKRGFRPPPTGGLGLFNDLDRDRQRVYAAVPAPTPWQPPHLSLPSASAAPRGEMPRGEMMRAKKGNSSRGGQDRSSITSNVDLQELSRAAAYDDDDLSVSHEDSFGESASVLSAPPAAAKMAPPPPPAPAPARRSMAKERRAPAGADAVDDVVNALVFPLLRLPGPFESGRGRLVPINTNQHYQQSAMRAGRPLSLDIAALVQSAEYEAMTAGGQPPPMCLDLSDLQSSFDFAYDADNVVDVVGDGTWNSVPLGDRDCEASVRYITVPREELAVYRVAVIQNPLSAPLLAGPAEIYVGGEYVLTTALPTVVAKGEFTLGLGVEQNIKVARNARFKEARDGEGVVAMVELIHHLDIEIVNHLPRAVDIEVRERIPVPDTGAEVQVSEREVSPPWEDYDQAERRPLIDGGRRWKVKVDAGATQALKASYVLRLFSNSEVQGGNRREQ